MEFIKNEVVFEKAPEKLLTLLTNIIQRKEISLDEIVANIDKHNLYAEIGGSRKSNFISIGFFESYERDTTSDLVAFCPQIKIKHQVEDNEITVYFYKESHPLLLKRAKLTVGESKIVDISQEELRYVLNEAHKLSFISD